MQVSDAFTDTDLTSTKQGPACKHTGGLRLLSSGRELVPALGLAWANCVNTRLFLSRTEVTIANPYCQPPQMLPNTTAPASLPLRYMQVVFSPCVPQDTCLYVVAQNGLQGVDNASIGFAQPQATGSRHTGTLSAKQQLSHTEAVMPSGTDAVLGCQHKHTGRHKLGKMQASPVGDNSLCPSNRVLTDPGSVQSASKKLACKLATGVFAPD